MHGEIEFVYLIYLPPIISTLYHYLFVRKGFSCLHTIAIVLNLFLYKHSTSNQTLSPFVYGMSH
jgi:hypothetical protein